MTLAKVARHPNVTRAQIHFVTNGLADNDMKQSYEQILNNLNFIDCIDLI